LQIIEIFRSIQGESSLAGLPCVFVRLAGCNLRCSWCDSEYTFKGGRKMSTDEVMLEVAQMATPNMLVEITGGEPMLQERELVSFIEQLLAGGYEVMMETSGERPLERVPKQVRKIVDVKCPGSGESGKFHLDNLDTLTERDELKFVLTDRADYEYARDFIREHGLEQSGRELLLSPAFRKDAAGSRTTDNCLLDPRELAEWMLADGLRARLALQVHKYVWEPQIKGV
jgi:7-carboxy-7-deazaguanine synthase